MDSQVGFNRRDVADTGTDAYRHARPAGGSGVVSNTRANEDAGARTCAEVDVTAGGNRTLSAGADADADTGTATETVAGRSCPLHYRYRPADLAVPATLHCDTLYVVGGLYGNEAALDRVLELFAREPGSKRLVFNGDFNWFNTDPAAYARINRAVLLHHATRGNVETELADASATADAGCGCAYPDWVGADVVERSNRILQRLRETGRSAPDLTARLAALPMWLRVDVAGQRVAIVHGDLHSLAGWDFAQELLNTPGELARAAAAIDAAQADIVACTHTCLPVMVQWTADASDPPASDGLLARARVLANNGAAGMPNFAGSGSGLLTRIATTAFDGPERQYGVQHERLHIDAIAIGYDRSRFQRDFLAAWPPCSDAHASYFDRIANGPDYRPAQALRRG